MDPLSRPLSSLSEFHKQLAEFATDTSKPIDSILEFIKLNGLYLNEEDSTALANLKVKAEKAQDSELITKVDNYQKLIIGSGIKDIPVEVLFNLLKNYLKLDDLVSLNFVNKDLNTKIKTFLNKPSNCAWILENWKYQLTAKAACFLAQKCGPTLQKLNLLGVDNLKDEDLKLVAQSCPNLASLSFKINAGMTIESVNCLAKLPLKELTLTQTGDVSVNDDWLQAIANLPLQTLGLNYTDVTDEGFKHLANMPLHTFQMREAKKITGEGITGVGFSHLATKPIKELIFNDCQNLTDVVLKQASQMPLQILVLGGCDKITDEGIKHLSLAQTPLAAVNLRSTKITDKSLEYLSNLSSLQELSVSRCDLIGDDGLKHLAKLLNLRLLDLHRCGRVSDEGLKHLDGLPLHTLGLGYCNISDDGLRYLLRMPLQRLGLAKCSITDTGLAIISPLPLEILNLVGCSSITKAGLELLKMPSLKDINVKESKISHEAIKDLIDRLALPVSRSRGNEYLYYVSLWTKFN